jgi:FkbM family methyltransferase
MTRKFYSQGDEDAILSGIFAGQTAGTCLEVGALDGIQDSVTLYFEQQGWSCVLIEADPELAAKATLSRRARVFACAAGCGDGTTELVLARGAPYLSTTRPTNAHLARIQNDGAKVERIEVPIIRVDDALQQAEVSKLDFASIDVEGAELDVLRGFNLQRWSPRVLLIEDNDPLVVPYLNEHGYQCFLHSGWNAFYARKGDRSLLTPWRRFTEWRRRIRRAIFQWTVGRLPSNAQHKLINWKRKWLGRL